MTGVTIIGLVSGQHTIEDIRVDVPYQVAVRIPADLAQRSRDLSEALQQKKVMRLSGALPMGAVLSGGGMVPRAGAPRMLAPQVASRDDSGLKTENAQLRQELEALREKERRLNQENHGLQAINEGLQTTLSLMSGQLESIRGILEELRKQGIVVAATGAPVRVATVNDVDGSAPLFIPSVKREDAVVNIKVEGQEGTADVSASRQALKKLRKPEA